MIAIDILSEHIENVFSVLPNTSEIQTLKKHIREELLDLEQHFIDEGYNPTYAATLALSKYGNIYDIINTNQIKLDSLCEPTPVLTLDEVLNYISFSKHTITLCCMGLSLILLAFPCFSFTKSLLNPTLSPDLLVGISCIPATLVLFAFILTGAVLIIFSYHAYHSYYMHIRHQSFTLCHLTRKALNKQYTYHHMISSILIGVIIGLIAPLFLLNAYQYETFPYYLNMLVFYFLISVACSIFIKCGTLYLIYHKLLHYSL